MMDRKREMLLINFYGSIGLSILILVARRQQVILRAILEYAQTLEEDTRTIAHRMDNNDDISSHPMHRETR